MRQLLIGLGAMLLVAGSIGAASALTLTDTTYFTETGTNAAEDYVAHGSGDVNFLSTTFSQALSLDFDYVTWNHQFNFAPAAEEILSATLTLSFRDDGDRMFELGFGFAENGDWVLGEVDTGTYSHNVDVASLADGVFQVTVASLWGDFYIDQSELSIDYTPAPVPEPAAMLLMGTGLAGLIAIRRRKTKKG